MALIVYMVAPKKVTSLSCEGLVYLVIIIIMKRMDIDTEFAIFMISV